MMHVISCDELGDGVELGQLVLVDSALRERGARTYVAPKTAQ